LQLWLRVAMQGSGWPLGVSCGEVELWRRA
jgi:hypothetical protein